MADYQLIKGRTDAVLKDGWLTIPNDPGNLDWLAYQQWLADGGAPDPAPDEE